MISIHLKHLESDAIFASFSSQIHLMFFFFKSSESMLSDKKNDLF